MATATGVTVRCSGTAHRLPGTADKKRRDPHSFGSVLTSLELDPVALDQTFVRAEPCLVFHALTALNVEPQVQIFEPPLAAKLKLIEDRIGANAPFAELRIVAAVDC